MDAKLGVLTLDDLEKRVLYVCSAWGLIENGKHVRHYDYEEIDKIVRVLLEKRLSALFAVGDYQAIFPKQSLPCTVRLVNELRDRNKPSTKKMEKLTKPKLNETFALISSIHLQNPHFLKDSIDRQL